MAVSIHGPEQLDNQQANCDDHTRDDDSDMAIEIMLDELDNWITGNALCLHAFRNMAGAQI